VHTYEPTPAPTPGAIPTCVNLFNVILPFWLPSTHILKTSLCTTAPCREKQIFINAVGSKALVVKADQKVYHPTIKVNSPVIGVIHDINAVLLPSKDVMSLF
jgi:hypothetical protein